MASKDELSTAPASAIATSKLERQRKRIEEAEAALANPLATERKTQTARGKSKWKPFNYAAESTDPVQGNDAGVPVSEVRVNTFRPPNSRDTSLSRSMSRLSQRTSEAAPSDMERQDSALTDHGFQLYKGRRNRKNVVELSAYEDKPEERQTTVEATFDEREIYKVFGNALPGREFIEENVGFKDGQVQFIQHPNGDVSAQQWSQERYVWENIGQFSNIRKKVEGQLASDRLKGETAYQALQQNTLAYFRTIGKQREANVMGIAFGPKDIQAAIPEPRVELAAAPTGLIGSTEEDTNVIARPTPTILKPSAPAWFQQDSNPTVSLPQTKPATHTTFPENVPLGPRAKPFDFAPHYSQRASKQEDPFYSGTTYQQIYGSQQYPNPYYSQNPYYNQRADAPVAGPFFGVSQSQRSQGLNYDFQFPSGGTTSHTLPGLGGPSYSTTRQNPVVKDDRPWQQAHTRPPQGVTTGQRYPQYHTGGLLVREEYRQAHPEHNVDTPEIAAPRPTSISQLNPRASMSDHLWKISETAKERTQSQANIGRTVLYNPLQNQSTIPAGPEDLPSDLSPELSRHVAGNVLQPPTSFDPTSSKFFPTLLAPQVSPTPASVADTIENNLRDSSPDAKYTTSHYQQTVPIITRTSDYKATPQILTRSLTQDTGYPSSSATTTTSSEANRKAYNAELDEWWTSGNKFIRQEEFYQSMMKSAAKDSESAMSSPPAHLTPIGPPSRTPKKRETPSHNTTMTRLMIPVLENLASYVQGPIEKRRDYFSQWVQPPEWCIDRSEGGNDSFYDRDWGSPPARVGRDPRYSNQSWSGEQRNRYGSAGHFPGGYGGSTTASVVSQLDRRFAFGGQF